MKSKTRENNVIKKLEKKYEKEFKYRKKSINIDSLNIYDNEGLYDAGFINGMRSLLMINDPIKYQWLSCNEIDNIIEETTKKKYMKKK